MINRSFAAALAASMLAAAAPSLGAPVFSTGYDMPNGGGQASGGSFNYWDLAYSGAGATSTDGAALSGGSGDLTDGVVANNFWYNLENAGGAGPYVGWYFSGLGGQRNPTITFGFAPGSTITTINVHVDNSWVGGVFAPAAILVDGVAQVFAVPAPGSIGWITLTGLNLTGTSHTLQLFQANNAWAFVSEVTFDGGVVPEPAAWAMLVAGFGLVGHAMRSRRRGVVAA